MQNAKHLFLSVAKEVLESTRDVVPPTNHYYTDAGVYCNLAFGVCSMAERCEEASRPLSNNLTRWLPDAFRKWPKFSGDIHYPILGSSEYYTCMTPFEMWSPSHPYGALRRELLEFLIDEIEKELNTEET